LRRRSAGRTTCGRRGARFGSAGLTPGVGPLGGLLRGGSARRRTRLGGLFRFPGCGALLGKPLVTAFGGAPGGGALGGGLLGGGFFYGGNLGGALGLTFGFLPGGPPRGGTLGG
jgi:hypothetical protein